MELENDIKLLRLYIDQLDSGRKPTKGMIRELKRITGKRYLRIGKLDSGMERYIVNCYTSKDRQRGTHSTFFFSIPFPE